MNRGLLLFALLASAGCSGPGSSVVRARDADNQPVRWLARDIRVAVAFREPRPEAEHTLVLVRRAFAVWTTSPQP